MTSAPPGPPAPSVWTDPAPVDPSWSAPVATVDPEPPTPSAEPRRAAPNRWRTPLVWGSLLLALLLVIGVIWSLGGFQQRRDLFAPTDPGATFTSGPYVLTFTEATAQYSLEDKTYDVIAIGTGRTTETSTMTPGSTNPFTFAQDLRSREIQPVDSYTYGLGADILLRARAFTPGLAPVRFTAKFEFSADPGDTLRLVVFDQEFRDASIFGDQDPSWVPSRTAHDLRLPLKRLPDRKY